MQTLRLTLLLSNPKSSVLEVDTLVTVESVTSALYKAAFIAGATAAGGPAAGGAAASYIASPVGQAAVEKAVAITVGNQGSSMQNMAMGGLVMNPTLAMIGEAGPEMVVPLSKKKRSRSARASDKKLSKAFKQANAKLRLKNGSLRKGKSQSDVARLAHRLRKKM